MLVAKTKNKKVNEVLESNMATDDKIRELYPEAKKLVDKLFNGCLGISGTDQWAEINFYLISAKIGVTSQDVEDYLRIHKGSYEAQKYLIFHALMVDYCQYEVITGNFYDYISKYYQFEIRNSIHAWKRVFRFERSRLYLEEMNTDSLSYEFDYEFEFESINYLIENYKLKTDNRFIRYALHLLAQGYKWKDLAEKYTYHEKSFLRSQRNLILKYALKKLQ